MSYNKDIVGINFALYRKKILNISQSEVANSLGITLRTIGNFENGHSANLNITLAIRYYEFLSNISGFPADLTIDDFLTKDLSTLFGKLSEKSTESTEPPGVTDYIPPGDKAGLRLSGVLSPGLLEFLNDEWEMAGMRPTKEEVEILKTISWAGSKEFYRFALADLRRSRDKEYLSSHINDKIILNEEPPNEVILEKD